MEISDSARKHDVAEVDILHAWENALRYIELEMYGEDRLLVLGPNRAGRMLELIAVPADGPARIIHADTRRAKFHKYLR
ncbi:hypothetical protein [Nocardia sp. NPDC057227]|uniref:hypothetical protein n=1 Tax=Nocardia sp. NPDC057227 TaxID=3346056 RepID=UPI003624D021